MRRAAFTNNQAVYEMLRPGKSPELNMAAALDGAVDPAAVRELRRGAYSKPAIERADLTRLLEIGRRAGLDTQEYADLLADVARDLLVNQADPPKYVSPADADWLIAQLRAGSGLSCRAEFEMLLAVLSYAVSIPPALSAFAVAEIEKAILEGHYSSGGLPDHPAGVVSKADVEALRSCVFAATEGSSLHVTRDSAEALFRIAHLTSDVKNDPSFDEFFAQAIGNYLMGIAHHWTPSAAEEAEREKWLDRPAPAMGRFIQGLLHVRKTAEQRAYDEENARLRIENDADRAEIEGRANIDAAEGDWVLSHLTRSGGLTRAEKRLLLFLKDNAKSLPPKLLEAIETEAK
jgi:hypothetical protein